jgi:hypothetical protein
MRKTVVILDDPPVHIVGPGVCTPAISMVSDFALELCEIFL